MVRSALAGCRGLPHEGDGALTHLLYGGPLVMGTSCEVEMTYFSYESINISPEETKREGEGGGSGTDTGGAPHTLTICYDGVSRDKNQSTERRRETSHDK